MPPCLEGTQQLRLVIQVAVETVNGVSVALGPACYLKALQTAQLRCDADAKATSKKGKQLGRGARILPHLSGLRRGVSQASAL